MSESVNFIETVKDGEQVVVESLPADLLARRNEATDCARAVKELWAKLDAAAQRSSAIMDLFWLDVRKLNERAETAKSRGLALGIRMRDNIPVIVAFKPKDCQCPMCLLKKALGGSGDLLGGGQ